MNGMIKNLDGVENSGDITIIRLILIFLLVEVADSMRKD